MRRVIQRTPDLGLTIQLRRTLPESAALPLGPAPDPDPDPAGCPCSATAVTWAEIPGARLIGGTRYPILSGAIRGTGIPYTQVEVFAANSSKGEDHAWTFVALPIGAAVGGVSWQFSWAAPSLWGETAVASGPLLTVSIPATWENWLENTLTATAYCGDAVVGTLTLTAMAPILR